MWGGGHLDFWNSNFDLKSNLSTVELQFNFYEFLRSGFQYFQIHPDNGNIFSCSLTAVLWLLNTRTSMGLSV